MLGYSSSEAAASYDPKPGRPNLFSLLFLDPRNDGVIRSQATADDGLSGELGSLAGDEEFRMSDLNRLTSHDDTASALDKQGLILRITVVAFLAALFWHTVVAAALP